MPSRTRTAVLGAVAGVLFAWNWVRLEQYPRGGHALLIVLLALLPALGRGLRSRLALAAGAFVLAGASAFDVGFGPHYPGRLLSRFGRGFLDFYDVRLPFNQAAQPFMHGTVLLAVFVFTVATVLAVAPGRAGLASVVLLVGAGWPATLFGGDEILRGSAILIGLLVLLAGLRERPRGFAQAAVAAAVVVLAGATASTSTALARHGFLNWQAWDFYTRPDKAVGVSYVWTSNYAGLTFPHKRTVVLRIKARPKPQYWRVVALNAVVGGRWSEDAAPQVQDNGYVGEPGLIPAQARDRSQWVEQRVSVAALREIHLPAATDPVLFDARGLGLVQYEPSGMAYLQRGLRRSDAYRAWSYQPSPTPKELAASKPIYPQLISRQGKYLAVDARVWVPPFGAPGREKTVHSLFTKSARSYEIAPYRPLYRLAREVAGGARSPYAAAVALESWFRTGGGFLYDQHPPLAHGRPALVDFVTRTHKGYCQHFAGAMALMLRYLGIPARAAAGFSSGRYDRHSGEWIVTDHDAHEWVEVWFRGWGWVPFDPTPGRGGLAGTYSSSSRSFDPFAAALVLAGKEGLSAFTKRRGKLGFPEGPLHLGPDTPDLTLRPLPVDSHHSRAPGLLGLLALLIAGIAAAIAATKLAVRRGPYLTRDPRKLAAACGRELRGILLDQGVDVPASATLLELARLARAELGLDTAGLGLHATVSRFGPPEAALEGARETRRALRDLRRSVRAELTRGERVRGLLSLRSLGLA